MPSNYVSKFNLNDQEVIVKDSEARTAATTASTNATNALNKVTETISITAGTASTNATTALNKATKLEKLPRVTVTYSSADTTIKVVTTNTHATA